MNITALAIGLVLLGTSVGVAEAQGLGPPLPPRSEPGFTLTTSAFPDGGEIPDQYTQTVWPDSPVSPSLQWSNVPADTVSFALLFRDPDVALRRTIEDPVHWLLFNIPGTARELPEGVPTIPRLPDGTVQAKNRRGGVGYMGPGAPAPGPNHHYLFELFALDLMLDLGPEATREEVLAAIDGHILAKAVLVGLHHM